MLVTMQITPLARALGAQVACGPLAQLDEPGLALLREALLDHLVLVIRDQTLTADQFAAFAHRWGEPMVPDTGVASLPHPCLHLVSNVIEDGQPIGILGHGPLAWHSDMAAFARPPSVTMLHALAVPADGGDTWFSNGYAAYETLPPPLRAQLVTVTLKHRVRQGSAGAGTGAVHPILRTHPETGCTALFLGAAHNTHLHSGGRLDSGELLALLWAQATDPAFQLRHRWRQGDVLLWDNRCTLHRRDGFAADAKRLLLRAQIAEPTAPAVVADAPWRAPHPRAQSLSVA